MLTVFPQNILIDHCEVKLKYYLFFSRSRSLAMASGSGSGPGPAGDLPSRNRSYDLNVSAEDAMINRQAAVTSPKGTLPRVLKSGKNARNVSSRNRSYDLNVSAETAMINRQAVVAPPMGTLPRVLRRPINAETPRFERSISPLRSMPKLNFESENKIHSEFEKTLKTLKSSLKSKPNDETEIDECNCCTSEVYYDKEKSSSFEGRSFSNPIGKRHIFQLTYRVFEYNFCFCKQSNQLKTSCSIFQIFPYYLSKIHTQCFT